IEEGLTYGVSSGFVDLRDIGVFRIESFSANETAERALDLALEVLTQFVEQGISRQELESARAYLRGQFPTDIETPEQLAEWLLSFEMRGLDPSYIRHSFETIEALSLEHANNLIHKHFTMTAFQHVLIGAPESIKFAEKYGQSTHVSLRESRFVPPYSLTEAR